MNPATQIIIENIQLRRGEIDMLRDTLSNIYLSNRPFSYKLKVGKELIQNINQAKNEIKKWTNQFRLIH